MKGHPSSWRGSPVGRQCSLPQSGIPLSTVSVNLIILGPSQDEPERAEVHVCGVLGFLHALGATPCSHTFHTPLKGCVIFCRSETPFVYSVVCHRMCELCPMCPVSCHAFWRHQPLSRSDEAAVVPILVPQPGAGHRAASSLPGSESLRSLLMVGATAPRSLTQRPLVELSQGCCTAPSQRHHSLQPPTEHSST